MIGYHVTERADAADILAHGFLAGWGDWGLGVYLFNNATSAQRYAAQGGWDGRLKDPVTLVVRTERAEQGDVPDDWDADKYKGVYYIPGNEDDEDARIVPEAVELYAAPAAPVADFLAGRPPRKKRRA